MMLALILYAVIPALCLFGIHKRELQENLLDIDSTLAMRGIGMLFIIFTHVVKENICTTTYFFYGNTAQKRCGIEASVVKYRHG